MLDATAVQLRAVIGSTFYFLHNDSAHSSFAEEKATLQAACDDSEHHNRRLLKENVAFAQGVRALEGDLELSRSEHERLRMDNPASTASHSDVQGMHASPDDEAKLLTTVI